MFVVPPLRQGGWYAGSQTVGSSDVMFGPHMTSGAVSPPRLSTEENGKGTTWKQDLEKVVESDITDARIKGTEELEIAHLGSLWSDQLASNTVNKYLGHRKSQEDSSLSLDIKSFGNSIVDLSCVHSYLRFVVLLPHLLPHVAY